MRILVLSDVSSYMRGGVPTETRQLLNGLANRGHEVAFAADAPLGSDIVKHYPIQMPCGYKLADELRVILQNFLPDVVHVIAMGSRSLANIAPVLRGHPWVMTCHSVPPYERKLGYFHGNETLHYTLRLLRFAANIGVWKWLLHHSDIPRIIVHSRYVQEIVTRYGYIKERTILIPLGFEPIKSFLSSETKVSTLSNSPRFVTVGGITHTKGQHDAILAMSILKHDYPTLSYQLAGEVRDSSYLQFLNKIITREGLQKHIKITPSLDEPSKQKMLQEADFYLQPSHEEGFCLAYIEAAAIVPRLVGADTGAIAAMSVDDVGTRVVPPKSPSAIVSAIRELASTTLPENLLNSRSLRLEKHFSWESYLDNHEQLYDELRLK